MVGGGATHWGTIPSKAIRRAIYHVRLMSDNPVYKRIDVVPEFSFPEWCQRRPGRPTTGRPAAGVLRPQRRPADPGNAKFAGPNEVESHSRPAPSAATRPGVCHRHGRPPISPPDIDFAHPRIFESDTLLRMPFTPARIAVYGAV
jgi:NAD(P) transhydrogenase